MTSPEAAVSSCALKRRALLCAAAGSALGLTAVGLPAQKAVPLPPELQAELPQAKLIGQGVLRFFGFKVYAIRAWSEEAISAEWWTRPLALEIEYARELVGAEIAKRSLKEMQRQAKVDAAQAERWLAWMNEAFPDVREGDRISGIAKPAGQTRFYVNGKLGKALQDAEFQRLFFGIWLSPQTSEPDLRALLLGRRP